MSSAALEVAGFECAWAGLAFTWLEELELDGAFLLLDRDFFLSEDFDVEMGGGMSKEGGINEERKEDWRSAMDGGVDDDDDEGLKAAMLWAYSWLKSMGLYMKGLKGPPNILFMSISPIRGFSEEEDVGVGNAPDDDD